MGNNAQTKTATPSTSAPQTETDWGWVAASHSTYDSCAAVAFLMTVINPDTALPYRIRVCFEDETGMQDVCNFRDAAGDPVVIDGRTYREELPWGTRVVEAADFAGVDIGMPRFARARALAEDLRTNNGAFESAGGFLKDQAVFPLSFVALIRAAWNTVKDLGGNSADERRDMFRMYMHPTQVYLAPDANRTPIPAAELDRLAKAIMAPFFTDSSAPWCAPNTTWMRAQLRLLNQAWEGKVAAQRRLHQQVDADWRAGKGPKPRRWEEPQRPEWKFADLPDQWWFSDHALTLCGYVRQLIRAWGSTDAETVEQIRGIVEAWLEHFSEVEESAPSLTASQKCVVKSFRYGANQRLIGRYIEVTDSRQAPKCWTIRKGERSERAHMLVVKDLRTGQVAILSNPGNDLDDLAVKLDELEPGCWALVSKLRDNQGRIRPHVFNGGWSRRVTVTQLGADQLIELIRNHAKWDTEVEPLPAARKPRKTGGEAFGQRNRNPRYSQRGRQVLPKSTLADTTADGMLAMLNAMVAKVDRAGKRGGKGQQRRGGSQRGRK